MRSDIGLDDLIAAARTLRRPAPAPLVIIRRDARCQLCGFRIEASTEARRPGGGVYVHAECVGAFAPYAGGGR